MTEMTGQERAAFEAACKSEAFRSDEQQQRIAELDTSYEETPSAGGTPERGK